MSAIDTRRALATFRVVSSVLASLFCCACASIRPLATVEAVRAFDYDGAILGGQPDRGIALALASSPAGAHSVDVILKNEDERRICVNGRFVVDCGQYDASPNLSFIVERASNDERVPLAKKTWTSGRSGVHSSWFKILEPREYHKVTLNLGEYFDLQKGENYRVYAEYNNQETGYKKGGRWIEMCAWAGHIKSNRLLLK